MKQSRFTTSRRSDDVVQFLRLVTRNVRRHIHVALLGDQFPYLDDLLAKSLESPCKFRYLCAWPDIRSKIRGIFSDNLLICLGNVMQRIGIIRPFGEIGPALKLLLSKTPSHSIER